MLINKIGKGISGIFSAMTYPIYTMTGVQFPFLITVDSCKRTVKERDQSSEQRLRWPRSEKQNTKTENKTTNWKQNNKTDKKITNSKTK